MAVYGLIHSLLASFQVKELAERWLGSQAFHRWYRPFFNSMAALTFIPVLILVALLPDAPIYSIPRPWVFLTLLIQFLAAAGLLFGVIQTGAANFLGLEQILFPEKSLQPRKMVTDGLYRWVRHPLYTCGLALAWLTPVMTWNILMFCLGVTAYLTIGTIIEERKLLLEFGENYAAYRLTTPMFFPRLIQRKG